MCSVLAMEHITQPLDVAIKLLGGLKQFADAISCSPQTANNWRTRGVPSEHCPAIERATAGAVTCEELLPAVCWVRVEDPEWPNPAGRPLVDHTQQKRAA